MPSLTQGQRILAAIMITDAVGFSARMSVNEGLTLQLIDRDLKLIATTCQEFGGTVLKSTGDGLLIYFLSAVEAVSCGLDMQRRLIELAQELPPDQYLDHRIGIHLGDILLTDQDVMGNGVNITARLQTYAKPRGLCVSQMIFDVVKARLNLHARFLGALKLKNIQETVPAYQLSLQAEGAEEEPQISDEPTCTLPMSTEALLTVAVKTLLTDANSCRIKKLIFAAYQQTWENDPAVLEQFDLRTLLENLRERYPRLEALAQHLQRIVMGLNRQTQYAQVAETILKQLQPWYSRSLAEATIPPHDPTKPLATSVTQQPCHEVAQCLEQTSDPLRTRKLLYCLAHKRWQNNAEVLQQLELSQLVQDVLEAAPRRQDLQYHLRRIIKHLNRQGRYTHLANEIMQAFQTLYTQENDDSQLSEPSDGVAEAMQSGQTLVTHISPVAAASDNGELTTLHNSLSAPTLAAAPTEGSPAPQLRSTLFDLRIEIIQYANPLRAKILLYSCLHGPFCYTKEAWSNLRRQPLDELLRQVFDYCPTYADLESKLTIIAHCLDQPDENTRAAGIIAQALKAYYPADPQVPLSADQRQPSAPKSQRGSQADAAPSHASTALSPSAPLRRSALSPA